MHIQPLMNINIKICRLNLIYYYDEPTCIDAPHYCSGICKKTRQNKQYIKINPRKKHPQGNSISSHVHIKTGPPHGNRPLGLFRSAAFFIVLSLEGLTSTSNVCARISLRDEPWEAEAGVDRDKCRDNGFYFWFCSHMHMRHSWAFRFGNLKPVSKRTCNDQAFVRYLCDHLAKCIG